jgi:hypothetical protein
VKSSPYVPSIEYWSSGWTPLEPPPAPCVWSEWATEAAAPDPANDGMPWRWSRRAATAAEPAAAASAIATVASNATIVASRRIASSIEPAAADVPSAIADVPKVVEPPPPWSVVPNRIASGFAPVERTTPNDPVRRVAFAVACFALPFVSRYVRRPKVLPPVLIVAT